MFNQQLGAEYFTKHLTKTTLSLSQISFRNLGNAGVRRTSLLYKNIIINILR